MDVISYKAVSSTYLTVDIMITIHLYKLRNIAYKYHFPFVHSL